jgi:hypothetical protein
MLHAGAVRFQGHRLIWKTWAPLRVKIFLWLAFRRRLDSRPTKATRARCQGLLLPMRPRARDNRPHHCYSLVHQGALAPHCPRTRAADATATAHGMTLVATPAHALEQRKPRRDCHTRFSKEQNQANHMCAQEVHTYVRIKKYQNNVYIKRENILY